MTDQPYDMVIIGGGVAGLVTASGLAKLDANVCLIEKEEGKLGGDCLYYGCVPSKTLIRTARLANEMRNADRYGLPNVDPDIDFSSVMDRMWEVIDHIEKHDDPDRFRNMGVDVRFGEGKFVDDQHFRLNDEDIEGHRFLISTGSSPMVPPIDGLDQVDYLTNETALRMDELPDSMIVVGAGPIGMELGQTFDRLGSDVHILETMDCILSKEDREISCLAQDLMEEQGLTISTNIRAEEVRKDGDRIIVEAKSESAEETLQAASLLMATGRKPNIHNLNLDAAGVEYEKDRIPVNRKMQTNRSHIYAAGDVTGTYPFTHVAEYQAGIIVGNIVSGLIPFYSRKADYSVVPWCTYTEPQVARVGMTEKEAREEYGNDGVRVDRFRFDDQDRALIEGENRGMIKLVYRKKWLGVEIVGAHICGPSAGELIHEYALAMNNGIGPAGISGTIHVYPTLSQSVKRGVDQYLGELVFEGLLGKFGRTYLRWTR